MNSATSLEELNAALKSCQNCSLGKTRTTLFPGQGTPRAKLFIVLDPPVGEDVTEGRVPSGPRAELLRNIIVKGLKMDPSEVYVTSVCKCPGTDEFIPEKGPLSACFKILAKEIQLVMPKVILTMGPSAGCTVSRQNTHMELLRKKRLVLGASKIPLRMTFGLSIMVDDDVVKRQCWQDLKGVLQLLAKP
jgi:DNA polymerase